MQILENSAQSSARLGANESQRILLSTYADGEFQYLADGMASDGQAIEDTVGDTLFAFLFKELSEQEGCDSKKEAARRVGVAIAQLQIIELALDKSVDRCPGYDMLMAGDTLLVQRIKRCEMLKSLRALVTDAKELRAIKTAMHHDYTSTDLELWNKRIAAAEGWLGAAEPFLPAVEDQIKERVGAQGEVKFHNRDLNDPRGYTPSQTPISLAGDRLGQIATALLAQSEPMASLSTAHLHVITRHRMVDGALSVHVYPNEHGGFSYVGETGDTLPEETELRHMILAARFAKLVWLKFDADAAVIPELPVFE